MQESGGDTSLARPSRELGIGFGPRVHLAGRCLTAQRGAGGRQTGWIPPLPQEAQGEVALRLLLTQAGTWDPLLQCLHLDTPLLEQQNTQKLYGTKNNCVHVQLGRILDPKDIKRPKNLTATFEEPGAKTGCWEQMWGTAHAPCTQHHQRGWATHLSHPSSPSPGHTPTLTPCKEPARQPSPSPLRERASKGTCCLFSLHAAAAGAPIKPRLNFSSAL